VNIVFFKAELVFSFVSALQNLVHVTWRSRGGASLGRRAPSPLCADTERNRGTAHQHNTPSPWYVRSSEGEPRRVQLAAELHSQWSGPARNCASPILLLLVVCSGLLPQQGRGEHARAGAAFRSHDR